MVSRSQGAIRAVRASAWRCPTIWMPTGIPSIASIGTVTAGAPRIEVGLALGRGVGRLARARRVEDDPGFHVGLLLRRVHAPRREGTFTFCPAP